MIKIVPYKKEYLEKLSVQTAQKHEKEEFVVNLETAIVMIDGSRVLGIFWFNDMGFGRLCAYSAIDAGCGNKLLAVVRKLKKLIEDGMKKTGNTRIEMMVKSDFKNGKKMAKLLGFEYEGTMCKVYKGIDYDMYARIF